MDGYLLIFCIFAGGVVAANLWVRLRYPIVTPRRPGVPDPFLATNRDCIEDRPQAAAEPESAVGSDRRVA